MKITFSSGGVCKRQVEHCRKRVQFVGRAMICAYHNLYEWVATVFFLVRIQWWGRYVIHSLCWMLWRWWTQKTTVSVSSSITKWNWFPIKRHYTRDRSAFSRDASTVATIKIVTFVQCIIWLGTGSGWCDSTHWVLRPSSEIRGISRT